MTTTTKQAVMGSHGIAEVVHASRVGIAAHKEARAELAEQLRAYGFTPQGHIMRLQLATVPAFPNSQAKATDFLTDVSGLATIVTSIVLGVRQLTRDEQEDFVKAMGVSFREATNGDCWCGQDCQKDDEDEVEVPDVIGDLGKLFAGTDDAKPETGAETPAQTVE